MKSLSVKCNIDKYGVREIMYWYKRAVQHALTRKELDLETRSPIRKNAPCDFR